MIDFTAVGAEAVDLLRAYLKIDTTNPPGNEIAGTRFLADVLARSGIESRTVESAPGRANLVARVRGDGSLGAVVAVVATAAPSMLSVRFRVPTAAFSSQIVNHTVPLTVVPSVPGCVMNTLIVPGEPTVTLRVAVAVRPPPSCTVSCS